MLTNCWIKHDLQRPNISSSFLDVSSPHLFGMSRVLRVPVQNRAGNIKRAVTSVLPCQPGVITGLTMIGSVSQESSAEQREWAETGSVWSGEAAGLVAGGGPMSVAVCLCAVNLCSSVLYLCPHGQCQPQSHVQSWPLLGGDAVLLTHAWRYFYSSDGEQCSQLCHQIVFCDFNLDFVTTARCNYRWGQVRSNRCFKRCFSKPKPDISKSEKLNIENKETFFLHFVTKQSSNWQASKIAEHFKPTFASWALTQLVKVFFWICSCSTVEAERDRNTLKWGGRSVLSVLISPNMQQFYSVLHSHTNIQGYPVIRTIFLICFVIS